MDGQQQIPPVNDAVGIDELPHAVDGIDRHGQHIGKDAAVPPGIAEEHPPEQHLFYHGHQHHQNHHRSGGGEGELLGIAHGVGIDHRQGNEPDQKPKPHRRHQTHCKGKEIFRQPVQQEVKALAQEGPENQKGHHSAQEIIDHVGLRHRQLFHGKALDRSHQRGEHGKVKGKKHPSPEQLSPGELGGPGMTRVHGKPPFLSVCEGSHHLFEFVQ